MSQRSADGVAGFGEVETLYAAHRIDLIRFATALVGPDDAPDVVSAAMLSLLKADTFVEARNPRALMQRAVWTQAKGMQRTGFARRARERRFAERWIQEQPRVRPDVVQAVTALSPRQRGCVFLAYWEDLPPARIGEVLGISEGSVKRHLARARARLREALDE